MTNRKDVECSVCHKVCGDLVITCQVCKRIVCESCELKFCVDGYHAAKSDSPATLAPPSHSTQIDLAKEFEGLDRAFLIAMIVSLRARVSELECGGIILKGWWCLYCDTFNGEEKEPRTECRHCGKEKRARGEAVRLLTNTRNER